MDHHHGAGELGTLGFVNGERIGELQVLKVGRPFLQLHRHAVEIDDQGAVREDIDHIADSTVHHVQVVVVPGLDDLVVLEKRGAATHGDRRHLGVPEFALDEPLQFLVQFLGAEWSLVGRRQHLHILDDVEPQGVEPLLKQLQQKRACRHRIGELIHQVPIPASGHRRLAGLAHLALENGGAVLLEDASLAHDLVEDDRGNGACLNQIAQDVSGSHRRKLVVVADQ